MAQKFWTTKPRFVDGDYIHADPSAPALVTFPDRYKIKMMADGKTPEDRTLRPYVEKEAAPAEEQKKPFAEIRRGPPDKKSHEMDRRPSDIDPAGK